MERRTLVQGSGLAGVLAAGAAPALVHAQTRLRWRLASGFPRSLDTLFGAADTFARKVFEMSGGRFEIGVHEADELLPATGVVDALQDGRIEAAHTAPYYFIDKDPTFALGCAIPFGLNSRQMSAWMFEGRGLKLMREFYAGYGIVNFPAGNTGAQMGGWFRQEVRSLADLKGLRFRIAGFAAQVVERLGALPRDVPAGAIHQALQSGDIDAAEWVGPYDDEKLGLHRLVRNYAYPAWWEGGTQIDLYIGAKAYRALSPAYRSIVEAAAAYAHVEMQARYDARNPAALKRLVAGGARLFRFPTPVMDAAYKASLELYSELSSRHPAWRKVYEDYAAFRVAANRWFRFAEAGFDDFMQAQRTL